MRIMKNRRGSRRQAGMTLVEISLASALMVVVSAGIVEFSDTSWKAVGTLNQSESVNRRAWRGIEQLTRKLRTAGPATNLVGETWVEEIQFRACQGFEDGEARMGNLERLFFQQSASDPFDGIDNDGDGIIDEGEILWNADYATSAADSRVVCRSVPRVPEGEIPGNGEDDNHNGLVDEPGFGVREVNGQFELVLTVAQPVPSGQVLERTMRRTLAVRMEVTGSETPGGGQSY